MEKFLHHADKSLADILHTYQLPLFIMGTERILGHFRKITRHTPAVIDYITGNYEDASPAEIKEILIPYTEGWNKTKQKEVVDRLEEAAGNKKLAVGIKDVWKEAMNKKGRLLVVEKNYMYPAVHDGSPGGITETILPNQHFSGIKDAVDDVIEKVLENGGDVEFVTEGTLKDFQRIALELYY
jgi:ribosomal protein L7Ae-like RNA K-turn-binding protein